MVTYNTKCDKANEKKGSKQERKKKNIELMYQNWPGIFCQFVRKAAIRFQ